jgi:hypothetical protein
MDGGAIKQTPQTGSNIMETVTTFYVHVPVLKNNSVKILTDTFNIRCLDTNEILSFTSGLVPFRLLKIETRRHLKKAGMWPLQFFGNVAVVEADGNGNTYYPFAQDAGIARLNEMDECFFKDVLADVSPTASCIASQYPQFGKLLSGASNGASNAKVSLIPMRTEGGSKEPVKVKL